MPATESFWRNLKTMHIVFALSAVALFAVTFWMMAEDHSNEWRPYQKTFDKIQVQQTEQAKQNIETAEFTAQRKALEEQVKDAKQQQEAAAKQPVADGKTLDDVRREVRTLQLESDELERLVKSERAFRGVAQANYDLGIRDQVSAARLAQLLDEFNQEDKKVQELEVALQRKTAELQAKQQIVQNAEKQLTDLVSAEKKLTADLNQLTAAENKLEPESWLSSAKRKMMDWYIIDGFNSPHKVQQDWLPDLSVTLGMTNIARFDRCRTCHLGIDNVQSGGVPGFPHGHPKTQLVSDWVKNNEFPHPFSTHPRTDLFLTESSPHPMSRFGCTVCHDGQGSGTSFNNAEHTPNNPHQKEEWEKEYGFHANHFWEYPMLPERFQEASCIKCHHQVVDLGVNPRFGPTAPKVYEGFRLVERYGCFGCHEIHGFNAGKPIGPDLRLEPQTPEEAAKIAADPTLVAGLMRKVGPSLKHIASKTTADWVRYWTEEPKRFRPNTRMPQFFNLSNQHDVHELMDVELAGITAFLMNISTPMELLKPAEGYEPNPERGKELFTRRGCLACHTHEGISGSNADFGPDLSRVHSKLKPGPEGFEWLYTWIQDPERYHPRTRMPVLFLEPYEEGGQSIDPAADIAAFLLQGGPGEFPAPEVSDEAIHELMRKFMAGPVMSVDKFEEMLTKRTYPFAAEQVKGDEIELVGDPADEAEWRRRTLNYVGRKTISRYGCFGCHDIKGFEEARPIGTTLQDWGRKDPATLAVEHIEEYLHEHGEPFFGTQPDLSAAKTGFVVASVTLESAAAQAGIKVGDQIVRLADKEIHAVGDLERAVQELQHKPGTDAEGEPAHAEHESHAKNVTVTVKRGDKELKLPLALNTSTHERIERALARARSGSYDDPNKAGEKERELAAAQFYESLLHHGRAGFLWQKLRDPRSYDHEKIETKGYLDRLRMPKFPFNEGEIEKIATFVLGLVAEPPAAEYIFTPQGAEAARIDGERLIEKYNCTGCHMLELPKPKYAVDPELVQATELSSDEFERGAELLLKLKPPRNVLTGESLTIDADGTKMTLPVVQMQAMPLTKPDPEEDIADQEYTFDLWETADINGKHLFPTTRLLVPARNLVEVAPARGGEFAEWLVEHLMSEATNGNRSLAWQMSPPPLYKQGIKVQTPWLFRFLKDPIRLRHTTVLRMPRFNMSDEEAQTLANYFAAVDGAEFPYQNIPQRDPQYLAAMNAALHAKVGSDADYLSQAWEMLNAPLCIKCHSVGGRQVKITNPAEDIRGPDLEHAGDRLRPDWLELWLFKPAWITPYTSMPAPLPRSRPQFLNILGGDPEAQTIGLRDALMNYLRLMEQHGKFAEETQPTTTTTGAGGGE